MKWIRKKKEASDPKVIYGDIKASEVNSMRYAISLSLIIITILPPKFIFLA